MSRKVFTFSLLDQFNKKKQQAAIKIGVTSPIFFSVELSTRHSNFELVVLSVGRGERTGRVHYSRPARKTTNSKAEYLAEKGILTEFLIRVAIIETQLPAALM